MTALFALFAFGTLGFWVTASIIGILVLLSLLNESDGWFAFVFIVAAIILGPGLMTVITLKQLLIGSIVYLIAGAAWSIAKWKLRLNRLVERARSGLLVSSSDFNVTVNKGKITMWIAAWPVSAVETIFHDLFESIYDALAGIYRRMAEKAQSQVKEIEAARAAATAK